MTPPKTRRAVDFHWDLDRLEAGINPPDPEKSLDGPTSQIKKEGIRSALNLGGFRELDENPMEALHGFEGARLLRIER